jgi:hypothetical protein
MSNDQELQNRLRGTLQRIEAPDPNLQDVIRRSRRLRTRQLTAMLVVVGLLTLAVGVPVVVFTASSRTGSSEEAPRPAAGAATKPTASKPEPPKLATRPGWTWHSDSSLGVAIQAPNGWTFRSNPVPISGPSALFALGTGPVPSGGSCAPTAAISRLAKNGMLMWVLEYGKPDNPYEFSPRAQQLALGPLAGPFECVGERTHLIMFRQAGRFFQVHVLFGAQASSTLRAQAVSALSSFMPQPEATPFGQLCREGPWVNCPEAAWVFRIINQAGWFHWGNTGSAIQASPSQASPASSKITIWTSHESSRGAPSASYRLLTTVNGTDVYGNGSRLVWQTQGFSIWAQLAAGSSVPAKTSQSSAFAKLVRASVRLRFINDQG